MHRIAGEEHAAFAVAIGEQQILPPRRAGQHFILHWNSDGPPIVLCAIDWVGIGNTGHDAFRDALARAAGWKPMGQRLHTPQIWIDHQVYEDGNELVCNWDVVEDIFPDRMVDDMFVAYYRNLKELAEDENAWKRDESWQLSDDHLAPRRAANATRRDLPKGPLHEFFVSAAAGHRQYPAIITRERTLTYCELERLT